jgi:hypothetical protein
LAEGWRLKGKAGSTEQGDEGGKIEDRRWEIGD